MCTVTYIPPKGDNSFILTSNRDEKAFRPTVSPKAYAIGVKKLSYPKDEKAGGSWFAVNENGKTCCLLNGAFTAHLKQEYHTVSRGAILLELTASDLSVQEFFASKELGNVEPFTIVTVDQENSIVKNLSEFVWDGSNIHFKELNKNSPYIWSSATLYDEEHRNMRQKWFSQFLEESIGQITSENIYTFHSGSHSKDDSINVIMKREGGLKTVSITQVFSRKSTLFMEYSDLINNTNSRLVV